MHLSGASLVNREAKLHQESFQGFQDGMKDFIHLVARTNTDNIGDYLATDPVDIFKVSVPFAAPLKVIFRFNLVKIVTDSLIDKCLVPF